MNLKRLFWLYVCIVAYLCLYPWIPDLTLQKPLYAWTIPTGRTVLVDLIVNLGLLAPMGILGRAAYPGGRGALVVFGSAAALTFGVEYLQTMLPSRTSSATDVLSNLAGAAVGYALLPWVRRFLEPFELEKQQWTINVRAFALIACFAMGQMFPFFPHWRMPHLHGVINALPHGASPLELVTGFITGLTLTLLFRQLTHPYLNAWLSGALTITLVMARVFFPSGIQPGVVLLAIAAGALVGIAIEMRMADRALGAVLLAYLLISQLAPFTFLAGDQTQQFTWTPFKQLMQLSYQSAVRILFSKIFLYGLTIYMLYRRLGLLAPSVAITAVLVALGEWAQVYMPSRTPETLDPLLAILIGLVLAVIPGHLGDDRLYQKRVEG